MFSLDLLLEVIMEAFYENMRKRILLKVNISANSNCWIWAGGLDPEKKIWQNWLCRPSLWGFQEEECQLRGLHGFSQGMGADPGLDYSHLCHNTLCCNPDHLVLERRSINNRNHCKNEMHCFGLGSHTKCLI